VVGIRSAWFTRVASSEESMRAGYPWWSSSRMRKRHRPTDVFGKAATVGVGAPEIAG